MKPYFTKYLPVEGEIIFPANIYCPHDGLRLNCQSMSCPDCKLVKLFLCSRDIQVGEKAYCLSEEEENKKLGLKQGDKQWIDPWCIKGNCPACIKVIGEISPEAKWVKEGMEFDNNEANWVWSPPYEEDEYYPISQYTWKQLVKERGGYKKVPIYLPPRVAIKCPCCGTFK